MDYDLDSRLDAIYCSLRAERFVLYPGHAVSSAGGCMYSPDIIDCCALVLVGKEKNALSHYNLAQGHLPRSYIPDMISDLGESSSTLRAVIVGGDAQHVILIKNELERQRIRTLTSFVHDWTPGRKAVKDVALDGEYRKVILTINRNAFLLAAY